jgi:hypothetical protein
MKKFEYHQELAGDAAAMVGRGSPISIMIMIDPCSVDPAHSTDMMGRPCPVMY